MPHSVEIVRDAVERDARLLSWNRSRSGVYGIRQVTIAGHARTIGVLTPCCDDDDVDVLMFTETPLR